MVLLEETKATLADLYRESGKAELIDGRIVRFMPTGDDPGCFALNIATMLREFVKKMRLPGRVRGDNVGFLVPKLPSGRESFSPDASYFEGPKQHLDFIRGAPIFAVEVRSKDGYGKTAERELAEKRADYFAAGTKVVWDVDSKAYCIYAYSSLAPESMRVFRRGEIADAEPAIPGWRVAVDDVFEED